MLVAGNARLSQDTRCEQRRQSRNAKTSFGMSHDSNIKNETAKSLPVCKAVSRIARKSDVGSAAIGIWQQVSQINDH
jgi:hypothetical protein